MKNTKRMIQYIQKIFGEGLEKYKLYKKAIDSGKNVMFLGRLDYKY